MIVSISQPAYLGWIGYYDRIAKSDLHIVLDHVQIEHNSKSFTNRNKIRQRQGWSWLTVPIINSGVNRGLPINEVMVERSSWRKKHWRSIEISYAKARYFRKYRDELEKIYDQEAQRLIEIIDPLNLFMLRSFGIDRPIVRSSELHPRESKSKLILELCKKVNAKTYLSGPFGRDYLDMDAFKGCGIDLAWHNFQHPEYEQQFPGFEPGMSALDFLLNEGPRISVFT